jgi:hypothetical protein
MKVDELKAYIKWLKYSIERFLPEEVILEKHGGFIERVLKADEYNQKKSAKLLKMEHMTKVIMSLDQTVLVSTQTVGFLNAPRSDDWNEGEGFMLLTNSNDGDNFYLHMYEYDIHCSLDSEQSRSCTTQGSNLLPNMFLLILHIVLHMACMVVSICVILLPLTNFSGPTQIMRQRRKLNMSPI